MAAPESHSPGWYPDPDDEARLRYWDGAGWTHEYRARPQWSPPVTTPSRPSEVLSSYLRTRPPGAPPPRLRWIVLALIATAAALAWALSLTVLKQHNPGPRTITDATFIAGANNVCKQMLTPLLKAQRPQVGDSNAVVADKTAAAATALDQMINALRQLPVQPADQAQVNQWLANWARYTAIGHQAAVADRTGDPSKYEPLLEQGQKQRFPVVDFAQANGIKSCTF